MKQRLITNGDAVESLDLSPRMAVMLPTYFKTSGSMKAKDLGLKFGVTESAIRKRAYRLRKIARRKDPAALPSKVRPRPSLNACGLSAFSESRSE